MIGRGLKMQVYKKTIIDILVIFAIITIVFFMAVVTNSKYFCMVLNDYKKLINDRYAC